MLIRIAEPAFLGPGLDWGCEPPGSDWAFAAVELVELGAAVLESVVEVTGFELVGPPGFELVGPPVTSVWAGSPAGPVLFELV